ncbi:MAG: carbamoyl transferase, partial [Pseudomonadota bacterium]|nr:carbamoyl transferase [Pseudomonadota bacterium]
MNILGIHSGVTIGQHDPGAALIMDGKIVAVIEEERLIRIKSPRAYLPIRSIAACLKEGGISIKDVDILAHPGETYEDMPARIQSYMRHYFGHCPEIRMINHQMAHLASAYYCSGFEDAMCISWDAYGDRLSASFATASRSDGIKVMETRDSEHSLGNFYAALTSYIGFDAGEDEFKVMGLAPYGNKRIDLSRFIRPSNDG